MSFEKNDPLFLNYLSFMTEFRGQVVRDEYGSHVSCLKTDFSFSVPHTRKDLPKLYNGVNNIIMIPTEFASTKSGDWKMQGGVTFMVKSKNVQENTNAKQDVRLQSGNGKQIVKDFSEAQCAGFLESSEAYESWAQWLTEANERNINNENVTFYVAHINNTPAAGAIILKSAQCIGIYGVATNPKFRKRGLGTLLLQQILQDASSMDVIGLQVETDSYAHKYYLKLGFENIYELGRFKNENRD